MEFSTRNQETDNLTQNQKVAQANVAINQPIDKIIHGDSYSFWKKLVRHTVWIIMLKTNWVNKNGSINRTVHFSYLSPKDLELGINTICMLAQIETFPDEHCSLKTI